MRVDICRGGETTNVKLVSILREQDYMFFMSTIAHIFARDGLGGLEKSLCEYKGWKKQYILAFLKYCENKSKGISEKEKPYKRNKLILDPISRSILKRRDYEFFNSRLSEAKQEFLDYGFLMIEVQEAIESVGVI